MNNQEAYLVFKTQKALRAKNLWDNNEYKERAEYELEVICRMGFASYYLVVADYCAWARDNEVPVGPGRGSGAGSLVAYAVGITDVDPIKWGLMFERFLNPGRISMPDFDVDFGKRDRSKVIQYVIEKYGHMNVCQIGTTGTMKSKLAVKDVARTMGLPVEDHHRFSSLIPDEARGGQGGNAVTLALCLNPTDEFTKAHEGDMLKFQSAYDGNANFHRVVNSAAEIEGIPKSFGVHPAGIIISDTPLNYQIPLRKAKDGSPVSQWSDKEVEAIGFVKFDFLGLRTLTVIDDAVKSIERRKGIKWDWDKIPEDDEATFDMISEGDCFGVFQLYDSGMSSFAKAFKPRSILEISTISALYRPGPLDNGMVEGILNVRKGRDAPTYPVKIMADILEDTDGILTYQEQVLEISRKMAGFSLSDADLLRRAIGKKKPKEMAERKEAFIQGSIGKGYKKHQAEEVFGIIEKFADYCFNKSHSVAYSILSFRTAYLKKHYPSDFYAAELSSYDGEIDKILPTIADARRHFVSVLPPDINLSDRYFTATDDKTVRFGLDGIKGLGPTAAKNIISEAQEKPFESIIDLCQRINSRSTRTNNLQALAKAGALDSIVQDPPMNRLELAQWVVDVTDGLKKSKKTASTGQMSFFEVSDSFEDEIVIPRPKIGATDAEILEIEKEAIGFYLSGSPLDKYKIIREKLHLDDIASLEVEDLYVTVLCRITSVVRRQNRRGSFAFVTLQDDTGKIEGKVWSNAMADCSHLLQEGLCVVLRGRTNRYRQLEIIVDSMVSAELEAARLLNRVVINRLDNNKLNSIMRLPKGEVPIDFELRNGEYRMRLGHFKVQPSDLRVLNGMDQ